MSVREIDQWALETFFQPAQDALSALRQKSDLLLAQLLLVISAACYVVGKGLPVKVGEHISFALTVASYGLLFLQLAQGERAVRSSDAAAKGPWREAAFLRLAATVWIAWCVWGYMVGADRRDLRELRAVSDATFWLSLQFGAVILRVPSPPIISAHPVVAR